MSIVPRTFVALSTAALLSGGAVPLAPAGAAPVTTRFSIPGALDFTVPPGVTRIAVLCPGFTADCLETIEEMGMTNKELFLESGGREYVMVPCLNQHAAWLDAMAAMVRRDASGWL